MLLVAEEMLQLLLRLSPGAHRAQGQLCHRKGQQTPCVLPLLLYPEP